MNAEEILENYIPVTETGCWLWLGNVLKTGYGHVWYENKTRRVHKVVYELTKGEVPNGLYVCHKCDIRSCVNPAHLYAGTPQNNMDDRSARGRQSRFPGESHPMAKLNNEQVLQIREMAADKIPDRIIATEFGISWISVYYIRTKRLWKHI